MSTISSLSSLREEAGKGEAVAMPLSQYRVLQLNDRIAKGLVPHEPTKCFCGADNYIPITDCDRNGITYHMVLCKECAIMYTNPRMSEAAFKEFYKSEYRDIYGYDDCIIEATSTGQINHTPSYIKEFILSVLDDVEIEHPKIVFEIGCGDGKNLAEWDCEIYGVDYDIEMIERGKKKGRNIICGGIEELEKLGKKADLIILHHVLEHFNDLRKEIGRIRELLENSGALYVSIPGLYAWDRSVLFQNAHNYQFNANTFEYMMNECGFHSMHIDEFIKSVWVKGSYGAKKDNEEHRYILDFILHAGDKTLLPKIRPSCKFPLKERRKNAKYVVDLGIPQITELIDKHIEGKAIIVGGGPSIEGYVDKIKKLKADGALVFSIERMYGWCLDHDIEPDYVIAMDACDDVIESFHRINDNTTHILMAQCKPEIFDLLKDRKTYFFFVQQKGLDVAKLCHEANIDRITFVNSGGSVTLGTMAVAVTLGIRSFHVFGYDCHVTNGNYAQGITGVGCINQIIEAEVGNRTFKTTPTYLSFMQNFFQFYALGKALGQIQEMKIYGDSLISEVSQEDIRGC